MPNDEKNILWIGKAPGGNYTAILASLKLPPGLIDAAIEHEDNCAIEGERPCNCNATVTITRVTQEMIDAGYGT
jgi:hypothetical protein